MRRIAVYGSLRAGFWNYERFGLEHCNRLKDGVVKGAMYKSSKFGTYYPFLFPEHEAEARHVREHVIEVYEVPPDLYHTIYSMEIGAGYRAEEIMVNDEPCTLFWCDEQGRMMDSHWTEKYDPHGGM